MKAKSVMNQDIITVPLGTTLKQVADILFENDISGVLVVDENNKLQGLISEKDIYCRLYPDYGQFYTNMDALDFEEMENRASLIQDELVENIMIRDVYTVSIHEPILSVGAIMLARKINRLPVLDDDENLVGIISRRNIYKAILKREFER